MSKQYEQRDNNGIVFLNDRKESETHCDFTGRAMVGGKMYWVSMWKKEGRSGDFFTLSFKPMQERPISDAMKDRSPGSTKTFKTPVPPEDDSDSQVPF